MLLDEIDLPILKLMEPIMIALVSDGVQIGYEHWEREGQLGAFTYSSLQVRHKVTLKSHVRLVLVEDLYTSRGR